LPEDIWFLLPEKKAAAFPGKIEDEGRPEATEDINGANKN